jgi:flagellar biosynthesis protein FlhG
MGEAPRKRAGRVISIAGGKGGVGKSLVSLNLGVMLGRLGYRTTIVDGDLGAPNVHTLFGVTRPGPGLAGFLDNPGITLPECAIDVGAPNLKIIPGIARPGSANLNAGQKVRLLKAIANLGGDVVIVDVGAGASYNTIDLVAAADIKLMVMTPQLTSLQNAYAFLKACVQRSLRRLPDDPESRAVLDELLTGEGESRPVQRAVAILRESHPELADTVVDVLMRFGVMLVGNMHTSEKDHAVFARMSNMISDYLMVRAPVVAALPLSDAIRSSVDNRSPIAMRDKPQDAVAAFRGLARTILDADIARLRQAGRPASSEQTLPIWVERELATGPTPG